MWLNFYDANKKVFNAVRMDARASVSTNLKRGSRKWSWLTNEVKYQLMKTKEAHFIENGQDFYLKISNDNEHLHTIGPENG